MKQHTWVENTLQEAKDQVLSRKSSETPIPREKMYKILRDDDSPSV